MKLLIASLALAAAAGVSARLEAPSGDITVGDPVVLTLRVTHPQGALIDFPDAAAAFSRPDGDPNAEPAESMGIPLVIVDEVKALPTEGNDREQTSWAIRVRLFKPGANRLPALKLRYRLASAGESSEASTEPLVIQVRSVLEKPDETPAANKGQWHIPRDWLTLLLWAGLGLLAAAILFLTILWLRRRFRARPAPVVAAPPAPPAESPRVKALRELKRLVASRMLAEGRIKEFHVALSEILKRFLGEQYGFDALDRTTEEILYDLSRLEIGSELKGFIRSCLGHCDLVKFARHRPEPGSIDEAVELARLTIEKAAPLSPSREAAA